MSYLSAGVLFQMATFDIQCGEGVVSLSREAQL